MNGEGSVKQSEDVESIQTPCRKMEQVRGERKLHEKPWNAVSEIRSSTTDDTTAKTSDSLPTPIASTSVSALSIRSQDDQPIVLETGKGQTGPPPPSDPHSEPSTSSSSSSSEPSDSSGSEDNAIDHTFVGHHLPRRGYARCHPRDTQSTLAAARGPRPSPRRVIRRRVPQGLQSLGHNPLKASSEEPIVLQAGPPLNDQVRSSLTDDNKYH